MKKKSPKTRNPFLPPARRRKAGAHKPKQDKRQTGKKKDQYLEEDY